MVALRSRRLETLLGSRLEELTHDDVVALAANQIGERFDLDFKGEHYGNGDSDKRALGSDVAALANTAGGLLVLGIAEDEQARAVYPPPGVTISDAEVRRIRQAVASNVTPLPVFDILPVEDPAAPGTGFLLVAVPRSPYAPHAVIVNDGFRYPRRNGTTTRYLSEPEIAAAYRDRFAGAARQVERAAQIESEGLPRLSVGERCWLVVSLVPDLPGDMMIDHAVRAAFREEIVGKSTTILPQGWSWYRSGVGRRRLFADGTLDRDPLARYLFQELHDDGCGVFAVEIPDPRRARPAAGDAKVTAVDDEHIVNGILSGLSLLARHARDRAAAGGTALVRAQLLAPGQDLPLQLACGRGAFNDPLGDRLVSTPQTPAERVAPLDELATDGPELVSTAYLLASDIFQAFGWAEAAQLTRDGQVRRAYWNAEWLAILENWATVAGVTVSDDRIQGG